MDKLETKIARQIADAAGAFQTQLSGHKPKSVTALLGQDTVMVTLYGALSPAERVLAQSADGAAQVQEFHRQIFAASCDPILRKIKRITGVEVREAVVHAFTTGTVVQVFQLARSLPGEIPGTMEPPTTVVHDL